MKFHLVSDSSCDLGIEECRRRDIDLVSFYVALGDDVYYREEREIPSSVIGEMVMEGLKKIDEVAYVRYASVYRQFTDISSFMNELEALMEENRHNKETAERKPE